MIARRGIRLFAAAIAAAIGWWLFSDTYRRWWGGPSDEGTIRFAYYGSYEDHAFWSAVIEEFEELHPGLSVQAEFSPGSTGHYDTKLHQQIASRAAPDVALTQAGTFPLLPSPCPRRSGHAADVELVAESALRMDQSGDSVRL